mgnify:CR=1 FL=1
MAEGFFFDEGEFRPVPKKVRKPSVAVSGCDGCGLHKQAVTPKMPPYGQNGLRIVVVGEAPGETEDVEGRPFAPKGRSGRFLRQSLGRYGLNLDRDCVMINAVSCRPKDGADNREPTDAELRACRPRIDEAIRQARPGLILALGTSAISTILSDAPPGIPLTATMMHGRVIPSRKHGCWVACGFHPSFYLRENGRYDGRMDDVVRGALEVLADRSFPAPLDESAFTVVDDLKELESLLTRLGNGTADVDVDFETTGLDPREPGFELLTVNLTDTVDHGWCVPVYHPHACWGDRDAVVWDLIRWFLGDSPCPKVIQNWQYEELVSRVYLGLPGVHNVVADTMVREHVLDNRRGVTGQEFQEYVRYGVTGHKGSVNQSRLKYEWLDDVARYGTLDCRYGLRWKKDQDAQMTPDLERAYRLFHDATPVLVSMTCRGIKVDAGKLDAIEAEVAADLKSLDDARQHAECLSLFRKQYGHAWDPSNPRDKKRMFFGTLKLTPMRPTDSKEGEAAWADDPDSCCGDQASLENCLTQVPEDSEESQLLRLCLDSGKLEKLLGTYIKGLREQIHPDGSLHPSFHLNTVQTYRSSSSDPNFQNFPKRDKDMARVRRVMVPQFDVFLEADYGGAEVRTMACRTKDRTLCLNVKNKVDFHRHYAALLYEKDEEDIKKAERFDGKNGFVFPEFYGSRVEGIHRNQPQWPKERIAKVEKILWNDMPDVARWQVETLRAYERDGYLDMMTGFRVRFGDQGFLSRFQIFNYPIQGPSFHRLLLAAVDVEKEMRRRELRSVLVGQIHDSLVTDCVSSELEEVIDLQQSIMTGKAWDWCEAVPWEVEMSVGKNLIDMERYL